MALQVEIPIGNTGLTLSYWRIMSFSYNTALNTFDLTLAGYKSKDDYDDGKSFGGTRSFHWQGDDNPVTPTVIMAGQAFSAVYTKVKQSVMSVPFRVGDTPVETNPFVNATDV